MAPQLFHSNQVKFLMDGENIMEEIRQQMDDVASEANVDAAQTYVRLAFWWINSDVLIGDAANRTLLVDWIEYVVQAGHNVDIIVWYPNLKARKFGGQAGHAQNHDALAGEVVGINSHVPPHPGRVRIYLERYEGGIGSSNHQKIAIFSRAGQRSVVVGGLNLANKYYDTTAHGQDAPWHDSALLIRGPATDAIEAEWVRRWKKVTEIKSKKHITLKKLSSHLKTRGNDWQSVDIALNNTPQTAYNNVCIPPHPVSPVSMKIALTRAKKTGNLTEIRKLLLERIRGANNYIYFENNQFTDPDILRALVKRKTERPQLRIIVITNLTGGAEGYLTRRSWLHLALLHPDLRQVFYQTNGQEKFVLKSLIRNWSVYDSSSKHKWVAETGLKRVIQMADSKALRLSNPWLDNDKVNFQRNTKGRWEKKSVKFTHITKVMGDFYFYAPVFWDSSGAGQWKCPCVHSKLAIIDDRYLIVGTANWTYRSMRYDGEITAFCNNQSIARNAKDQLLRHYNPPNPPVHPAVTLDNIHERAVANWQGLVGLDNRFFDRWLLVPMEYCAGPGPDDYRNWFSFNARDTPKSRDFKLMPHPHFL